MTKSKFLKLKTVKLADYFEVRTNRVLNIDNISDEFSSSDDPRDEFSNITTINPNANFGRFLVQIKSTDEDLYQLTEVITLNDDSDILTLTKNTITPSGEEDDVFGEIEALNDDLGAFYLQFKPDDPFNKDYDIKVIQSSFQTRSPIENEVSVGFVDLLALTDVVVGLGSTSIISVDVNKYSSLYVTANLINEGLDYKNYVELHVTHDGTNSYLSELYFDDLEQFNGRFIGSFTSYISDGNLNIDYINTSEDDISVRCRNVGFGSTSIGIGTYRFSAEGQPDGSERSAIYESEFYSGTGSSPINVFKMDEDLFSSSKSIVNVSIGDTVALHQLALIHDGTNINLAQYPFLSVGSTTGIGTFSGEYSGNDLIVKFYPDSNITGIVSISSFNEKIYSDLDLNSILPLDYFPVQESLVQSKFFGLNLDTINRTQFGMYYEDIPIFVKTFNPIDTSTLDKETGIFTINNHFFSNLERLIYDPRSTFIDVGESAMGIGSTLNSVGVVTDKLPEEVYVIKINPNQFRLSTRKDYAQVGIYVTFTDNGEGNSHDLEMYLKNEKTVITVANIIQYPLLYTSLEYTLSNNGGQIGAGNTVFALSGISSINPQELLKIEDEYVFINNVGLGTTSVGPITFDGDFFLVDVERGAVGSAATSHTDGTAARLYRGSYNIVKNDIFFTSAPRGSAFFLDDVDELNLERYTSQFQGRVFLRNDYSSNFIYDDISEQFSGTDTTYTITSQGINTVGLGESGGNGLLALNGIFQAPTTDNNLDNNFLILEDSVAGVSSVFFTGITSVTGELVISSEDVNQNQLPRGGLIVSLGSTTGLGYAPLVGASVTAIVGGGGSITGISTDTEFGSYGSGYREPVSIGVTEEGHGGTEAIISATVGAGGTLSFTIDDGGTGYTNPQIIIEPPNYEKLSVVGVSRLGVGETTDSGTGLLISVDVQPSSVEITGVGSDVNILGVSTTTGDRFADAASLIERNKEFIANEAVNRMIDAFSGYPGPGDQSDCEDDVVDVFETINYNLQYGGNDQVYDAANIYIQNTSLLDGEQAEAIYTFEEAKDIAIQVIRNEVVSVSMATTQYSQVFDNTITIDPLGLPYCADVASAITQFVGIVTVAIGQTTLPNRVVSSPTLFEVKNFKIDRPGYGYRRGDVVRPVGLVTSKELSEPREEFQLTITETFNDKFALWNFGELNYIDSIKRFQDGLRTRFPLFYNSQLISFEKTETSIDSGLIDIDSLLLIFINGVLQTPGEAYIFGGGTSFVFTTPPKPEDQISIFFYVGTEGDDSALVDINETLKIGDQVQVLGIGNRDFYCNTIETYIDGVSGVNQNPRYITDIPTTDKIETNTYSGAGIDDVNCRPLNWIKQKRDLIINNEVITKARDSIEPQIYPTSKIIKDFESSDTEIYVEDISLFVYDNTPIGGEVLGFDLSIYEENVQYVSAGITATVSIGGTIESITINESGSGYIGTSVNVKFSRPYEYLEPGIVELGLVNISSSKDQVDSAIESVTASGILSVSNGQVSLPFTLTNPGVGYTPTNPPDVIVEFPTFDKIELATNSERITGAVSGITSIRETTGIGTDKGLEFTIDSNSIFNFDTQQAFSTGYPFYISNSTVGNGVTSIDTSDSDIIGIGTVGLDNIYYAHSWDATSGIITANILSTTDFSSLGIPTSTSDQNYPVAIISWGKISELERNDNSISLSVKGNTVSGLSTYPVVQRREYGLRSNGSIKKLLN